MSRNGQVPRAERSHCVYCGVTTKARKRVCGSCSDLPRVDPHFQAARKS